VGDPVLVTLCVLCSHLCVFPVSPQEILLPPRFRALSHRHMCGHYGHCLHCHCAVLVDRPENIRKHGGLLVEVTEGLKIWVMRQVPIALQRCNQDARYGMSRGPPDQHMLPNLCYCWRVYFTRHCSPAERISCQPQLPSRPLLPGISRHTPAVGRPVIAKSPRIGAHRGLSGGMTPKMAFLSAYSKNDPTCGSTAQHKHANAYDNFGHRPATLPSKHANRWRNHPPYVVVVVKQRASRPSWTPSPQ
jgi:hypothetical protein